MHRIMELPVNRFCSVFLILFIIFPGVSNAFAQQNSEPTAKFTSQTNLVLVPVQVRSKGQHLAGLKQDAFSVLQDGKEQKIAVFEEVRTTTDRLKRAPVQPNEFSNELVGNPQTARYTVIAIDRINTTTMDMIRLREGLMKFLAQAADTGEPVRLISIENRGIRLIHDFTTDPKAIALALQQSANPIGRSQANSTTLDESLQEIDVMSTPSAGASAEQVAKYLGTLDRLDKTKEMDSQALAFQQRSSRINSLEALQQVALSLSGLPGRKTLVWASSGYAFSSITREGRTSVTRDYSQVLEATALDEYTTHLLNSANIAVYPVDARGTVNTAFEAIDPSRKYSPTAAQKESLQQANQDVITTFEHLAASTGGKPCFERSELSGCFKDALEDSHDYYMLGFYIDPKGMKDGWHKIQVKVSEKGASVRSRNGYLYPMPDPAKTRDQDMNAAINSLLIDAGLPFRGEWFPQEAKGNKKAARFAIVIDPDAGVVDTQKNRINVEFAGTARAKDGTIAAQFAQKIDRNLPPEAIASIKQGGINYKNVFELAPGDYLVRFIVRDNLSGRIGGVSTLLKVQ